MNLEKVEIVYDEEIGLYSIKVNGETVLECLNDNEVYDQKLGDFEHFLRTGTF